MRRPALPHLGHPDGILVGRVHGHDIAETAGQRGGALQEDRHKGIAPTRMCLHTSDSDHTFPPPIRHRATAVVHQSRTQVHHEPTSIESRSMALADLDGI